MLLTGSDDKIATASTIAQWLFRAGQVFYVVVLAISEVVSVSATSLPDWFSSTKGHHKVLPSIHA